MAAEDVRCHEIMRERDEREVMTSMQGASALATPQGCYCTRYWEEVVPVVCWWFCAKSPRG